MSEYAGTPREKEGMSRGQIWLWIAIAAVAGVTMLLFARSLAA